MTPSSLVSVIIPCYNVEDYVERAVASILDQTYSNLQVLLVDDASTDGTLRRLERFNDPRVQLLKMGANTRKIGAVNEALKLASGAYIAFQDADDWSDNTRLEKQVNEFREDAGLGICFTGYRFEGKKSCDVGRIALSNDELRDEFLQFGYKANSQFNATTCATMMITREVLERTKGYDEYFKGRVGEDIHWIYRILKSFRGKTIPSPLYHYNLRDESFTGMQSGGKNVKAAYSWQLLCHIIEKDVVENIDVLSPEHNTLLQQLELRSCEEALLKSIDEKIRLVNTYENSNSLKVGRKITGLFGFLKRKGRLR